jgi:CubicO group peptidase (beta-lactamase class C family)
MNRKIFLVFSILWLVFSLLAPSLSAKAEGNGQPDLQAIDTFLQEQVRTNRIPGLAVTIVKGDKVIFAKGYGETSPGKPVTPQTQFYIGSVTKSFTALAALQLVEQGKLNLDASVQQYLPWFQVTDPQAASQITVRHLLNHTSGLNEKGDPNAAAYTDSLESQARLLKNVRPAAPAGSRYEYCNQNYRLVGLLIETISGQSYGDYLRDHIFIPLGMTHSVTNPADAPDLAQGYSRFFGFALPRSQRYIPGALPSGYLITTAEDMGQYLRAQINNQQADGTPMLQSETLSAMRTPPIGVNSDYGMGWMVMENDNTLVHGGALENFQSFVAFGLKERVGFVMLVNQNSMENMLFENNAIRDGLLALLNGETPQKTSYAWISWLLIGLFIADLLNHLRLYWMLPRWLEKTAKQPRPWLWLKVLLGIIFPATVVFGVPSLVHALEGGAPNWVEPFNLMPDLTVWLLLGMALNLVRSVLHAFALLRNPIH